MNKIKILLNLVAIVSLIGCFSEKEISAIKSNNTTLYPILENEKWGFANELGQKVIACEFDTVSFFGYGLSCVKQDGKFGYLKPNGEWHLKPKFTAAGNFDPAGAMVNKNGKQIRIDWKGRRSKRSYNFQGGCIPPAMPLVAAEYAVERNGKYALRYPNYVESDNSLGYVKVVDTTDYLFNSVTKFSLTCLLIEWKGKYGLFYPRYLASHFILPNVEFESYVILDGKRKNKIDFIFDEVRLKYQDFANTGEEYEVSKAEYRIGDKWGIMSNRGQLLIEPKYLDINLYNWNLAKVEYEVGRVGYIDMFKGTEYFEREKN